MQLIEVSIGDMPLDTQRDVRALCIAASMAGGTVRLKTVTVTFDARSNALTIHGNDIVRFQLEEPVPQYRWN